MSCDRLTLGKINFWIHSKSGFTSPATFFECYDGTGTAMGRRRFQRWVRCNFGTLKKSCDFSSVNTFLPNLEVYVSIQTVLYVDTFKLPPGTLFVLHIQNSPNIQIYGR